MQETDSNNKLANYDLSKVAALQQKRTLAFVNHFTVSTVQFLNNFMKQCEQKLMQFERKLERVEAAMVLLETRLSSIPEVNDVSLPEAPKESQPVAAEVTTDVPDSIPEQKEQSEKINSEPAVTESYPEYNRFVKMIQVGVPIDAVKLKVRTEGLDPDILEKVLRK